MLLELYLSTASRVPFSAPLDPVTKLLSELFRSAFVLPAPGRFVAFRRALMAYEGLKEFYEEHPNAPDAFPQQWALCQ